MWKYFVFCGNLDFFLRFPQRMGVDYSFFKVLAGFSVAARKLARVTVRAVIRRTARMQMVITYQCNGMW